MTDRDPWIDGLAKLSGRSYEEQAAMEPPPSSEPYPGAEELGDWCTHTSTSSFCACDAAAADELGRRWAS